VASRSVVPSLSEEERDRIEADLLLLVVCAHMAFRSANGLDEATNTREHFIDAVRALHYAVAADRRSPDAIGPSQVM
jgi:hypothetical protein